MMRRGDMVFVTGAADPPSPRPDNLKGTALMTSPTLLSLADRDLKPHERMALEYLSGTPDRIRYIEDDNTLAAAIVYCNLEKREFVTIDKDDGMLVTITAAGRSALEASHG